MYDIYLVSHRNLIAKAVQKFVIISKFMQMRTCIKMISSYETFYQ